MNANRSLIIVLALASQLPFAQTAAGQEHWVATWAAAQQQPRPPAAGRGPAPPVAAGQQTPAAAPRPTPPPASFTNQTIRMIVHTTIGGRRVRVQMSNAYGTMPLTIGSAHVALRSKDSEIVAGSDRVLTFSTKPSFRIPPGASIVSDPVDLSVPQLGDLAVSVYVPGESGPLTTHALGLHTTYISPPGDFSAQPAITDATTSLSWYWLASVDVLAPADTAAIVTFGDSITDGATSTPNTDRSWPAYLAARLLANTGGAKLAVVNEGISGNRILTDGAGVNALARFDRDVLDIAGVKWVTILEGINDIGLGLGPNAQAGAAVTADDLIGGLRQMIERAHMHGIKVIGCTLTPYEGAFYASEEGEKVRQAVNRWIMTGGAFDSVVDFDAVTRDPENAKRLPPAFNISDHLHPNDAGYKAMADAFDLSVFMPRPAQGSAQR
jgi:lysophospholipase L1-like esterase